MKDRKFLCLGGPLDEQYLSRDEINAYYIKEYGNGSWLDYYLEYNCSTGRGCKTEAARAKDKAKGRPAIESAVFIHSSKFR